MQLRNWISEQFGSKDTLLDKSVYSPEEIQHDKVRLKQQRKRINKEMSQYATDYQQLLEKGAQANAAERKQYSQQAKIAKKKYKVKQQQYQKNSVQMATIVTIEGARELKNMTGQDDINLPDMDKVELGNVQEHLMDEMVQYELDMDVMMDVQDALDIDIIGADVEMGDDEEMEIMNEIAAGEVDAEQIDIESAGEMEDVDTDVDDVLDGDMLGVGPDR